MFHAIAIPIAFVLLFIIIIYYLLRQRKIAVLEPEDRPPAKRAFLSPLFSPFSSSRKVQKEIQEIRARRKHKMLAHEWEGLLLELGIESPKAALSPSFHKLKNLVEESRHAGRWKKLTKAEQSALERLHSMFQQKEAERKPMNLSKKKAKTAIAALKKMLLR